MQRAGDITGILSSQSSMPPAGVSSPAACPPPPDPSHPCQPSLLSKLGTPVPAVPSTPSVTTSVLHHTLHTWELTEST